MVPSAYTRNSPVAEQNVPSINLGEGIPRETAETGSHIDADEDVEITETSLMREPENTIPTEANRKFISLRYKINLFNNLAMVCFSIVV